MGKIILYIAWVIIIVGVIIHKFVYEFPGIIYPLFLIGCVLLGLVGYFIDRREIKKKQVTESDKQEIK